MRVTIVGEIVTGVRHGSKPRLIDVISTIEVMAITTPGAVTADRNNRRRPRNHFRCSLQEADPGGSGRPGTLQPLTQTSARTS
jgi:hypothetical protein